MDSAWEWGRLAVGGLGANLTHGALPSEPAHGFQTVGFCGVFDRFRIGRPQRSRNPGKWDEGAGREVGLSGCNDLPAGSVHSIGSLASSFRLLRPFPYFIFVGKARVRARASLWMLQRRSRIAADKI